MNILFDIRWAGFLILPNRSFSVSTYCFHYSFLFYLSILILFSCYVPLLFDVILLVSNEFLLLKQLSLVT